MKQKAPRSTLRLALTQRLRLSWTRWQLKRQGMRLRRLELRQDRMLVEMDSLRLLLKLGEERWELLLLQRDELHEIQDFRLEGLLNPQDHPQLEASRSVRDAVE